MIRQLLFILAVCLCFEGRAQINNKPNVVIIYADDLGYGDLSSYGATEIQTPHIDALAEEGVLFTNAHASAPTCTPSRYSLMTGNYPFRKTGTNILPGDAKLIISKEEFTLPKVFKEAGYYTAIIGKWHLGLGDSVEKNWNEEIKPGPLEVGFDYSFIFPATADRVPTIFIENHRVVGAEDVDPIQVSYEQKIGEEPTGKENPELLKMKASPNHGHDNTIINGIGRIGWMSGGHKARWVDEELTFTFADKVKSFIEARSKKPFFLFYNAIEPHVPRMPATMFKGESDLGYRGDAILQLDHTVGEIVKELKNRGVYEHTIILFTSDNGPVLDDGYVDGAVEQLNGHDPFGGFRGGKYSAFEAGTRMPFIISWPEAIKSQKTSDALVGQVDLLATFGQLLNVKTPKDSAIDSYPMADTFFGKSEDGREKIVKSSGTFSLIKGKYKYILPSNGAKYNKLTDIELGNDPEEQLYDLDTDPKEENNIAKQHPKLVKEMKKVLQAELDKEL